MELRHRQAPKTAAKFAFVGNWHPEPGWRMAPSRSLTHRGVTHCLTAHSSAAPQTFKTSGRCYWHCPVRQLAKGSFVTGARRSLCNHRNSFGTGRHSLHCGGTAAAHRWMRAWHSGGRCVKALRADGHSGRCPMNPLAALVAGLSRTCWRRCGRLICGNCRAAAFTAKKCASARVRIMCP